MPTSYLLKITLQDTPHTIWRRFIVPSDITLDRLHDVIQIVMGWQDCHLHAFVVGKQYYKSSEAIALDSFDDAGDLPEEDYTLEKFVSKRWTKIKYLYDFGDNWTHEIVVENNHYVNHDNPHPVYCIEGVRACPPEDCGGVWGFADFCEAMADPKHEEHRDLKSWYGGKFDPDHFDVNTVNKRLGVKRPKKTAKKVAKKATKKAAKKKPRGMWVLVDKPEEK